MPNRTSHSSSRGNRYSASGYDAKLVKGSEAWMEEEFRASGLDDSFYKEWMMNPYWQTFQEYNSDNGLLSGLSESLLGSSASSRNARQAEADARAYWAKILDTARQQNYDLPVNQVGRERSAGLNPALLGIDSAGSSAGVDVPSDITNMEAPSTDIQALGSVIDGVSFLTSLATDIIAVRKGFKELKNLSLVNEGLDIGNSNSKVSGFRDLVSYGEWIADNMITADSFKNYASDGDKFLEASMVTADGQLVKNYLPNGNAFQRTVLTNALNNRFRSNILESKSWEDYAKLNEARNRSKIAESDLEKGFTLSIMACKKAEADYNAALTRWKAELMEDEVFEELWKSNEFASLRESISESNANAAAADISYAGSSAVLEDTAAMKDVTDSAKQVFRTSLMQLIEEEASAILGSTNAAIIQEFYDSYANSFGANWKYRPLSPDREKLDIALGIGVSGFSQSVSVLDLLLKRKNKSKK